MKKKSTARKSSCELGSQNSAGGRKPNRSAFYTHRGDYTWHGTRKECYKTEEGSWANIHRRVLIGAHGESTRFHVRYFEIGPGGYSSIEKHAHEHVVIGVKGEGFVRIGEKKKKKVKFMDTVYIAPNTIHQLLNPFPAAFGFLCIVNAVRDKPVLLSSGD